MPFFFIALGILLVIAAARNKTGDLGALLAHDFTGPGNFFYWIVAVVGIGSIGYAPSLEKVSRAFLLLLLVVVVLANKGLFEQLTNALASIKAPTPASVADVGVATGPVTQAASPDQISSAISNLPATATEGPSQERPNILPGQANTDANSKLNSFFGNRAAGSSPLGSIFQTLPGLGVMP